MKIKSNSLIANYYKWLFYGKLPKDFCTLFWNTLFSIILMPSIIITYVLPFLRKELWGNTYNHKSLFRRFFNGIVTWFIVFILAVIGLGGIIKYLPHFYNYKEHDMLLNLSLGLLFTIFSGLLIVLICLLIVGIFVGLYEGGIYLNKKIQDKTYQVSESKPIFIVTVWNTIRNKYCTKIEWEK